MGVLVEGRKGTRRRGAWHGDPVHTS